METTPTASTATEEVATTTTRLVYSGPADTFITTAGGKRVVFQNGEPLSLPSSQASDLQRRYPDFFTLVTS